VRSSRAAFVRTHPTFVRSFFLDDFRTDVPEDYLKGFPWHPHRGIGPSRMCSPALLRHGYSMGNRGLESASGTSSDDAARPHPSEIAQRLLSRPQCTKYSTRAIWPSHKDDRAAFQEVKLSDIPVITDDDGTQTASSPLFPVASPDPSTESPPNPCISTSRFRRIIGKTLPSKPRVTRSLRVLRRGPVRTHPNPVQRGPHHRRARRSAAGSDRQPLPILFDRATK